jgi:Pyridoxamine 5'-phosphate oxidase
MIANPWLAGPAPTNKLTHDRLTERILNLLSSQNMCVLATSGPNGPFATPMHYDNHELTIFMTARAGSPKLRNIANDPRVSVGIFAPLVGEASSRGAQLFGRAEILVPGDDGFDEGMTIYRWQPSAIERGRSLDVVPQNPIVRLTADRIVYTEHWLRREGFAPRQTWRRR